MPLYSIDNLSFQVIHAILCLQEEVRTQMTTSKNLLMTNLKTINYLRYLKSLGLPALTKTWSLSNKRVPSSTLRASLEEKNKICLKNIQQLILKVLNCFIRCWNSIQSLEYRLRKLYRTPTLMK